MSSTDIQQAFEERLNAVEDLRALVEEADTENL